MMRGRGRRVLLGVASLSVAGVVYTSVKLDVPVQHVPELLVRSGRTFWAGVQVKTFLAGIFLSLFLFVRLQSLLVVYLMDCGAFSCFVSTHGFPDIRALQAASFNH
jgi:hypothetical protein